jgi:hypothetical protein
VPLDRARHLLNVIRRSQLSVLIFSRQEMVGHHLKDLIYFLPLKEGTQTALHRHRISRGNKGPSGSVQKRPHAAL